MSRHHEGGRSPTDVIPSRWGPSCDRRILRSSGSSQHGGITSRFALVMTGLEFVAEGEAAHEGEIHEIELEGDVDGPFDFGAGKDVDGSFGAGIG